MLALVQEELLLNRQVAQAIPEADDVGGFDVPVVEAMHADDIAANVFQVVAIVALVPPGVVVAGGAILRLADGVERLAPLAAQFQHIAGGFLPGKGIDGQHIGVFAW